MGRRLASDAAGCANALSRPQPLSGSAFAVLRKAWSPLKEEPMLIPSCIQLHHYSTSYHWLQYHIPLDTTKNQHTSQQLCFYQS